MLLEIFTDSLCSKPPPPSLDILWCKVLFFKTWISVVFSTVFLKKIENHKFSIFFPLVVPKMSLFFRMALFMPRGKIQPAFTFSKSTIETLEQRVKFIQT